MIWEKSLPPQPPPPPPPSPEVFFYPIEIGFSPEIIEFYAENYYQIFTIPFLNFFLISNLDIIYDVTIAVTWDEINTNK